MLWGSITSSVGDPLLLNLSRMCFRLAQGCRKGSPNTKWFGKNVKTKQEGFNKPGLGSGSIRGSKPRRRVIRSPWGMRRGNPVAPSGKNAAGPKAAVGPLVWDPSVPWCGTHDE